MCNASRQPADHEPAADVNLLSLLALAMEAGSIRDDEVPSVGDFSRGVGPSAAKRSGSTPVAKLSAHHHRGQTDNTPAVSRKRRAAPSHSMSGGIGRVSWDSSANSKLSRGQVDD